MSEILKLQNINMIYNEGAANEVRALKDFSLNVTKGELISVIGPSGSGKSTLLHIMGGLLRPSNGTYMYEDKNVSMYNNKQISIFRNQNIGFVLQNFGLLTDRTVIENVCIPMLFSNYKWSEMKDRAMSVLKSLNIENLAERSTNNISGGQSQRVAIARAIVMNPSIILADEPTGALDSENAYHLMDVFNELNQQGTTIIIVTHNNEISNMCKRTIKINDGSTIE